MTIIDTRIVAVTVYTDRARVTRRGKTHLTEGEQTLALASLPRTIMPDSVRASGTGVGVKILGVQVDKVFATHPPEVSAAELERQLEALQDQDRALVDEDAAATAQIKFLATLRDATGRGLGKGLSFGNATLDLVQQFVDYSARELSTAQTRQRAIGQQRREQKRKIDAVQAQLGQTRAFETNERYEIRVIIEASAETDFEIEVNYGVTNARWSPLYDVRLHGTNVALSYLGEVTQASGEDWQAVEMMLSTARLAKSTEIPELKPYYIDAYKQPVMATRAMMEGMVGATAPAYEHRLAEPANMLEATIKSSGAAVTYRVARPVTVPSDNAPHKTAITTLELAAQLDYITAPKLAEEAYLRAKIINVSEFVFLAGRANVFHDADFVGATDLETIAANEEFEVHLGVDDRIKVKRELTERTVDKTLLGNTRRMLFGYKITLRNLQATNIKITVLDQLPVARNEDIKVKLREATPKPNEQSDLNVCKWELDCKPHEKREIAFGFSIEHPRESRLIGLTD